MYNLRVGGGGVARMGEAEGAAGVEVLLRDFGDADGLAAAALGAAAPPVAQGHVAGLRMAGTPRIWPGTIRLTRWLR